MSSIVTITLHICLTDTLYFISSLFSLRRDKVQILTSMRTSSILEQARFQQVTSVFDCWFLS